jgi:hypothetical protein
VRGLPVLFALVVTAIALLVRRVALEGMRTRTVDTALSPDEVRALFADAAAGLGWRVWDEGPVVAQSTILAGVRQRIELETGRAGGRTQARVGVTRYDGQWVRWPRRPWPLRRRINRFLAALAAADPTLRVGD